MFSIFKKISDSYYKFWFNLLKLPKRSNILPINFKNHWLNIIFKQKNHLVVILLFETLIEVFYTLIPRILGWIVEQNNILPFAILIGLWFLAICLQYISAFSMTILETQCIASVQYNAYEYFMTVDPIYHFRRESGKLFAKIERGARSYESFLDLMLYDLGPTLISITTAVVALFIEAPSSGIIAFVMLSIIACINILLNLITGIAFEPRLIEADDHLKAISIESLTQVQLIRANFASEEISQKVYKSNKNLLFQEGTAWLALAVTFFITRLLYLISIAILGYVIIKQVLAGEISTTVGLTLILTYMRGTYQVITIGRKLRKVISSVARIQDLYTYVREFGVQTFPVLEAPKKYTEEVRLAKKNDTISLIVTDLSFDYNTKARIFDNHYLHLDVNQAQEDKLYGIIGPSGMGKTTLLSILGGQLKPHNGQILINGVDIYKIDDNERSQLIALQGQIPSSLSGTLKSTVLLGLPAEAHYSDYEIINILEKVGIWHLFKEKDGLDTYIGEAGLTLSGGQRQRLNFAALFIRAQYYKPLLLLIDEPTSSLDPVSEIAITEMISELAKDSLTLVIAHRINTLDKAVAILDFSLIPKEKRITFYTRDKLEEYSAYYRKLLSGQIDIIDE